VDPAAPDRRDRPLSSAPYAARSPAPVRGVGLSMGARSVHPRLDRLRGEHPDGVPERVLCRPGPPGPRVAGVLVLQARIIEKRTDMKVAILGSGAVGGYYGARL